MNDSCKFPVSRLRVVHLTGLAFGLAAGITFGAALLPVAGTPLSATGAQAAEPRADVPLRKSGRPEGYLKRKQLPDSGALLPPPPQPGSAAAAGNEEIHRRAAALRNTPRWELAARDANLHDGGPMDAFACALGVRIDETRTPRLYQMLYRLQHDVARSAEAAKEKYGSHRPFVVHGETTCTPARDAIIREEGSYPSGHAANGWAMALVLTELAPERADALLARGRAYGESRIICNAHWQTDVLQGRLLGSATLARLQGVADFREDITLARTELDEVRKSDAAPPQGCAEEARALESSIPGAL